MGIIKMLGMCILCGGTTSLVTQKRFGYSLPLTFMSTALVMEFVALIAGIISPAYIIIGAWALLFPLLICYRGFVKNDWNGIKDLIVTPALFVTIIFIMLIAVYDSGAMYSVWDEYSHWGPMVKVMWESDKLYCLSEAQFAHHDYPPAVQLFELLICKVVGGCFEPYVYRALHLLSFSFLLPIMEDVCLRSTNNETANGTLVWQVIIDICCKVIISMLIFLSVCITIMPDIFNCVYTDALLGIEGAIIIWMLWNYDFSIISTITVSVYLSFLLMSKQMGLTFFILSFLSGIALFFLAQKLSIKEKIVKLGVVYGIPVLVYEVYHLYTSSLNLPYVQFATNSLSANLIDFILRRNVQEHQTWVIGAMTKYILTEPLTWIGIPYIGWFAIFVACGLIMIKVLAIREAEKRIIHGAISSVIITGLGYFVFAGVMLALYIAGGFNVNEVYGLASLSRYLGTYMLASYLVLASILMFLLFKTDKMYSDYWKHIAINEFAIFIGFIMVIVQIKAQPDTNLSPAVENDVLTSIRYQAEKIEQIVNKEDSIYIISQEDDGYYYGRLNYFLLPNKTDWKSVKTSDDQSYSGEVLTAQTFVNAYINGYDYLYLYNINDVFREEFVEEMGLTNAENGSLYKINYKDDIISFTEVKL